MANEYTGEYRAEAVKLAQMIGSKRAAIELGVPQGTIGTWVRYAKMGKIDAGIGSRTTATAMTQAARIMQLEAECNSYRKENARLKKENAFLEEASAFFAASRQRLAKTSGSSLSR
jgi:transposase